MIDREKLRRTVIRGVDLLVRGDYQALESLTGGVRLTAQMLRQAVDEYPGQLVMPPDDHLDTLVEFAERGGEIKGSNPPAYWLNVDLWTAEEGRSDLTLSLSLIDTPGDMYEMQIDDLHVL